MQPLRMALAAFVIVLPIGGCNRSTPAPHELPDLRHYGALPQLEQSSDPALQDELARLRAAEMTPAQLDAAATFVPDELNVASGLMGVVPRARVQTLLDDIARIYPTGKLEFNVAALESARDLLLFENTHVERLRAALARPQCDIPLEHSAGLLADTHVLQVFELAHRLEALAAAVALADGDLAAAQQSATRLLAIDHALACEPHLLCRLLAVRLRGEALRVVEAIVQDEQATLTTLVHFRELLARQLADWPSDADAWIGERAQGLHTYEMIRGGYLLSILSEQELQTLRQEAGISSTVKAVARHIDADQHYYLAAMREVIDACDMPFFERRQRLAKIEHDLREIRNSPEFPLVAGRLLLTDLVAGHRAQAQDLAQCQAWYLALALASGAEPPSLIHPETGMAHAAENDGYRVLVRLAQSNGGEQTLIVPLLGPRVAQEKGAAGAPERASR